MTEDEATFMKFVADLDSNEKAMLLHTMQVMAKQKSKSATTRRLNDFKKWIGEYRAEKVAA